MLLLHRGRFRLGQFHFDSLTHQRCGNHKHNKNREHHVNHIREVHFLIDRLATTAFHKNSLASHFFQRQQVAAFEQAEHPAAKIIVSDFVFSGTRNEDVVSARCGNGDNETGDRRNQSHRDARGDDGQIGGAVFADFKESAHNAPHGAEKSKKRSQIGAHPQKIHMSIFVQADAFYRTLDRIFQKRSTVLYRIVTQKAAEFGRFDQDFFRQAFESAHSAGIAKVLQVHKPFHFFKLAIKAGVGILILKEKNRRDRIKKRL